MVLYTHEAWSANSFVSAEALLDHINLSLETTNQAMDNSEIALKINVVYIGPVSAGWSRPGDTARW